MKDKRLKENLLGNRLINIKIHRNLRIKKQSKKRQLITPSHWTLDFWAIMAF